MLPIVAKRRDKQETDEVAASNPRGRPSALLDTRVIYCGDCLDQLRAFPAACVELARVLKKTGSFYYHCDWHSTKIRRHSTHRHDGLLSRPVGATGLRGNANGRR
jgi:hypothetical protein